MVLREAPSVHAEGAEAAFDLEKGDGFVEDFRWEMGESDDLIASAGAGSKSLEDFGFDVGIAKEASLR